MLGFQEIIIQLKQYWLSRGCLLIEPFDMEVGAGTFHPATFLRSIGPEPWHAAFVQASRRPTDGRYGKNPNRGQHFYQFQVVLKPSPADPQQAFLNSLKELGINPLEHDIRFVEDNWESPTLGAWGYGWEVWLNGMEITQFTYFQQVGGLACDPITCEITYGLERIAMALQGVDSLYDIRWNSDEHAPITYGELFQQNEVQQSAYNFEHAHIDTLLSQFSQCEKMAHNLIDKELPQAAYEQLLKTSHLFNLLDARQAISVTERQGYILRIRKMSYRIARAYYSNRQTLDCPLLRD